MIELINKDFGIRMWVSEDRIEEYKAAGHVSAAEIESEAIESKIEDISADEKNISEFAEKEGKAKRKRGKQAKRKRE